MVQVARFAHSGPAKAGPLTKRYAPQGYRVMAEFEVTGLFYEMSGHKFRKHLDIKGSTNTKDAPDLMVVMMNPGSSYPLDKNDNNSHPSAAVPDPTQDQIMKVMRNLNFSFARILNLSDLRNSSSNEFYNFINSAESKEINHSIFCKSRHEEFSTLFNHKAPVIYAWGVNKHLEKLANQAINKISSQSPIGLKKPGSTWAYYHPLPRIYSKQQEWVTAITSMSQGA